ncbi:serine/threonine-protein kinase [Peptoniphilus koenoeneniae]|uniref:non-specific serine/threonine protein kinase n=1 Tax=Peptoniphilus koenoeneniae TaxID=507751 RepID=A0ABU0AUP6_9FIRM|nr:MULTISPECIES: Stk1 family PASTA domain-containing Ser/Thr kinase [Peptoniphilus]ERT59526.1 putative serine/threonine-protein kinase PrkC [Peptoniphilus sp. BV3C26]MDQ0274579.1 serine/threonine-protein kinase [Peptoniphilus koenoeneniae]
MIGKILGNRYEILEKIGTGGMGDVYKAHDRRLDRIVAIKILKQQYNEDSNFIKKFKRESLAAASISHPSIVSIYDVGSEENQKETVHYIVMEFIDGKTLKELIQDENKIPEKRALNYAIQIAEALKVAHSKNIVHRDIKSQNIMITRDDRVKVTDFGIARIADNTTVTATNAIMGSVHYFSPEQARGGKVDNRSDIYSLGIVIYEMLTGKLPFDAENPVSVALMQVQSNMPMPSDSVPGISKETDLLVKKLTMKDPEDRYENAQAVIRDIKNILLGRKEDFGFEEVRKKRVIRRSDRENIKVKEEDEPVIEERPKKPKKEKSSKLPVILGSLTALLLVALLIFVVPKVLSGRDSGDKPVETNEKITVPVLVGKTESEANSILAALGLKPDREVDEDDTQPSGVILSQEPKDGEEIEKGSMVKIVVNKLPDTEKIPNLVGRTLEEAKDIIKGTSLEIGEVKEEYNESIDSGKIISTSPESGYEVGKGQKIDILISKGVDNNPVNLRSLKGIPLEAAKGVLDSLGLKYKVENVRSNKVDEGEVASQNEVGEVSKSTEIILYVSEGPLQDGENEVGSENSSEDVKSESISVTIPQDGARHRIIINRIHNGNTSEYYNYHKTSEESPVEIELKGSKGDTFNIFIDDEQVDTRTL